MFRQVLRFVFLVAAIVMMLSPKSVSAATVDVYVYNNAFSINPPGQPIVDPVITVGDTVRWIWVQGSHTTTSVAGSLEVWDAPINSMNQSFTHTFTHVGTWWYYCQPHGFDNGDGTASGMAGTVTVVAGGIGACCLTDGSCLEISPTSCLLQGGIYQGDDTTCKGSSCSSQEITLQFHASHDNVLYEDAAGSLSNGMGQHLHVGTHENGLIRRSVLRFDLSQIPPGAKIQDASLQLYCNRSSGSPALVSLHRVLQPWGEGTSQASGHEDFGAAATIGDATWLHAFYPKVFWITPGGDFAPAASSLQNVTAANAYYTWSTIGLVDDVQRWVNDPDANFGWLVRGNETSAGNVKRFDSRHSPFSETQPLLTVRFLPPGPQGACCLSDAGCVQVTAVQCATMGGIYQGNDITCEAASCSVQLEPFVDELPRPAVAQPVSGAAGGQAHYEIAMTEQFQQLHRDLPPTRVWGYAGSFPGPTIEAYRGEPVTVIWKNDLRIAETGELRTTHALVVDECLHGPDVTGQTPLCVVHLHGGKVPPESDGYPELAFPPGEQSPVYTYPNDQPAATLWYHDHAHGITRLNVIMGLAGFYIIRDEVEDALNLPRGEYEIPLAIQDRSFNPDGSLKYPEMWHEHFFGDTILVNGKVWPYLKVNKGKYRFRLLNGSNSRAYRLSLSDSAIFWQIGTDLGLLESPVPMSELTILPGERADVVMDFALYPSGTELVLVNSAPSPFPGSPGVGVVANVMKFIVQDEWGHVDPLPQTLAKIDFLSESQATVERTLAMQLMPNMHCPHHHDLMWSIDGLMWHDITETPRLGTTEIWGWYNASGISHPMHLHLVAVQVLDRQAIDDVTGEPTGPRLPPAANEMGWKDTVDAPPGYITRVITRFEGFPGYFPYHCHILEHEDHVMMRQFKVLPACTADITGNSSSGSDNDNVVDVNDLLAVISAWGACPGHHDHDRARAPVIACPADIAPPGGDGLVNVDDLLVVISNWGPCPQ